MAVFAAAGALSLAGVLPAQAAFGPINWLHRGNTVPAGGYPCTGSAAVYAPWVGSIVDGAAIFWTGCHLEPNHPAPPPNSTSPTQVYLREFHAEMTLLLSTNAAGMAGDGNSTICRLSPNGRYATFLTEATDIVSPDTNGRSDIIWMDIVTGVKERISDGMGGQQGNGDCYGSLADDSGRFVAFNSMSSNIVPNDNNSTWDVFLHDRLIGTTTLVSAAIGGGSGNGYSGFAGITPDGEYVLFHSEATNLVQGPLSVGVNVYLWSRSTGQVELISPNTSTPPGSAHSPSMSHDARYVAFIGGGLFCLRDRQSQTTTVLPVYGDRPLLSGDGRYIAFNVGSGNYVPYPSGTGYLHTSQPYRYDRLTGDVMHAGVTAEGGVAVPAGCWVTAISPDGRYMAVETANHIYGVYWPTAGGFGGHYDFWAIDMGPGETLGPGSGGVLVPPRTGVVEGAPGLPWSLSLRYALPLAPAVLAVKAAPPGVPTPMYGGQVHPWPPDFLLSLSVPASGPLVLPFQWMAASPQGTQVQGQWAVLDPASATGVSISNAYLLSRP